MKQAYAIEAAFIKYEEWKKEPTHYDKLGFGFNQYGRFQACNGLTIHVDSWMGTYDNSGASSFLSLDDGIFNKHLLKVLNNKFDEIMNATAQSIREEAKEYRNAAEKELDDARNSLESLGLE